MEALLPADGAELARRFGGAGAAVAIMFAVYFAAIHLHIRVMRRRYRKLRRERSITPVERPEEEPHTDVARLREDMANAQAMLLKRSSIYLAVNGAAIGALASLGVDQMLVVAAALIAILVNFVGLVSNHSAVVDLQAMRGLHDDLTAEDPVTKAVAAAGQGGSASSPTLFLAIYLPAISILAWFGALVIYWPF